jgi:hypothetical protein
VGISVGITAPDAPTGVLWVMVLAMFFGRLEFLTIIVGLVRLIEDVPAMLRPSLKQRLSALRHRRASIELDRHGDSPSEDSTSLEDAQREIG